MNTTNGLNLRKQYECQIFLNRLTFQRKINIFEVRRALSENFPDLTREQRETVFKNWVVIKSWRKNA